MEALSNAIAGGERKDPRTYVSETLDPAMPGVGEIDPALPGVGYDEALPGESAFDDSLPAEQAALDVGDSEEYAPPALDVPELDARVSEGDQNQTSQGQDAKLGTRTKRTPIDENDPSLSNDALRAAKKGLRNGYVPKDRLKGISGANPGGGQGYLLDIAAHAWELMRLAAMQDGVRLYYSSTYRSYGTQKAAYDSYKRGERGPGVVVAPPGRSQHGWGLAVDVSTGKGIIGKGTAQWQWLRRNAARFGWYGISSESWHWEYRGKA
jgi:LAS superfamily LD-carboxypeptidase LdcB